MNSSINPGGMFDAIAACAVIAMAAVCAGLLYRVITHGERNHQGLENALIEGAPARCAGRVHRPSRLGGLLNFYRRAA